MLVPGLFGSGLLLMVSAAVLWVTSAEGSPAEPYGAIEPVEVAASTSTSAIGSYETGRALFVAKGCAGCHVHEHAGVPPSAASRFGPDLTRIETVPYAGMPNDPEFLRNWLKDPQSLRPATPMPNLGLTDLEIEDLLAFLLPGRSPAQ